jgi:hypothetical protein
MREKRVGFVSTLGGADVGGSSSAMGKRATGERTVSPVVRSDVCSSSGGLYFCNAIVGGMFVTCLMNVAMAR